MDRCFTLFRCTKDYLGQHLRWHHLSLLLIPVILTVTILFEDEHALIYVPFTWGFASLILFTNFPDLLLSLHSRPIYYDDLIMRDCDEQENTAIYDTTFRKKYQNIFRWVVTVSSSVMVGLIVEVWYFRDDLFPNSSGNNVVTNTVIISIIGGLSRIYYGASLIIGRIIMWILKYYKQRDIQRQRDIIHEQVELSVTETGVKIVMEDDAPLLTRSVSHDAIQIIALKPNVMSDVFN